MFFFKRGVLVAIALCAVQVYPQIAIPFSFSTHLYPQELPLKKMHALSMEVWGTIDAGVNDSQMSTHFQENQIFLLSRVMLIHSMFDALLVQLAKIMNENPERYDHILSEVEHLYNVLQDAHATFQPCVTPENTYTYGINHVLEIIIQRIRFLLQTRLVISPYYALMHPYQPSAITPLLVPTYMLPVAPIV